MHAVASWTGYGNRTLRDKSGKSKYICLISLVSYFSSSERSSLAEELQQRK